MTTQLFCPKCAGPMRRAANGELTCADGNMGTSKAMEHELLSRFAARFKADAPPPETGAKWFCPACRLPLGDDMECANCGGSLKPLLRSLVEIHVHDDWPRSRIIH